MLAGGTYTSTVYFRSGKTLTLMAAGTGSVVFTASIGAGSVSDTNCGLVFDGVVIQPTSSYFMDGSSFGNINLVAFHNDTIQNVYRCLIRGGNTTPTNLGTIEILNCIIKNCGSGGYALLYPKFIVSNVIVKNSTLIRYYGGENFFRPQSASTTNVFNFDFENNTIFKWSKGSSYALCNTGTSYSTASVYTFKNNLVAEPGVVGQTPKMLNTTGGNLTAANNLIVNYGGYTQTSAVTSSINDLSGFTAAMLYAPATGFQDTTAVKNDFRILASSALATAGTTGGIVGDPRWLKTITGVSNVHTDPLIVQYHADGLYIAGLAGTSKLEVFSCEGKKIYTSTLTQSTTTLPIDTKFCIVKVIDQNGLHVRKAIYQK